MSACALLAALPAAALARSAAYGTYSHERQAASYAPCENWRFHTVPGGTASALWGEGPVPFWHDLQLRLEYYGGCGAYASISDNSGTPDPPLNCWVFIDRSDDGGSTWVNTAAHMDPKGGYAETLIANDLSGRLARGAIVCDGQVLARTRWY